MPAQCTFKVTFLSGSVPAESCSEHKEDFEGFLGEEFAAYCTTMERSGIWGDELTLVWAWYFYFIPTCAFLGPCSLVSGSYSSSCAAAASH
jgi:hypothetical protein